MHVAHVLGYLASRFGGPPQVALRLGKTLEGYGVRTSWWATATAADREELAFLGKRAHLFEPTFPHSWYRSVALARALQKEIGGMDVLHLHQVWDYPLWVAGRLALRTGKPYLITPHGIFNERWRYASPKKALYLRLLFRPIVNGAACLHALTAAERDACRAAGIQVPIAVIPNGVDVKEFEHLPPPQEADHLWPMLRNRLVVLFLGRLSPEKGLEPLLKAWRQVTRAVANAALVLAGPDVRGYRARVEAMVREEDLVDRVFLTGMVQGEEKRALLSRADLFVLPSYSEAFSVALLEALACAKPCVMTTGCHFPEVTHVGAGMVVPPKSEALAEALLHLLEAPDGQRRVMGEAGRNLVRRSYAWDVVARRMLTVYRCLVGGQEVPSEPEPAPVRENIKDL